MVTAKILFLIVLGTIASSASAFHHLVPSNKEVIYDWRAIVQAGSFFPDQHASQFTLHGKLHVQANPNATLVWLKNLSMNIYNGAFNGYDEHQQTPVPLPAEAQHLEHPFKIVHDEVGLAVGISVPQNEQIFSVNVKKAIAAVLQVNHTVVDLARVGGHPHAFVSQEKSVYGWHQVDNSVVPKGADVIELQKFSHYHDTRHVYGYMTSNLDVDSCELEFSEPLTYDSQRKYVMVQQDGHWVAKHILATGGLNLHPLQGLSDSQFVSVNQTYHLVEITAVAQPIVVKDETLVDSLSYQVPSRLNADHLVEEDLINISHHSGELQDEKAIAKIQSLLKQIAEYLEDDHLTPVNPNGKKTQMISRLRRFLVYFDLQHLEKLHQTLVPSEGLVEIFHRMLPLVGTKASTLLIKKLIIAQTIVGEVAVDVLQNLPDSLIYVTPEEVEELVELTKLPESLEWKIRQAGVIAFGSIVQKAWMHLRRQNILEERDEHVPGTHNPKHYREIFEKYVVEYIAQIRKINDYEKVVPWMWGLANMNLPSVVHHLTPAIRGEWWPEAHWRSLALRVVSQSLSSISRDGIVELLLPILANRQEHTELRILSYLAIMRTRPSLSDLNNIHWLLMTETNDELYNVHYTLVQAVLGSNEPCQQQFRIHLRQIWKFMQPSLRGVSTVTIADYIDQQFGFSSGVRGVLVHSNDSTIWHFEKVRQLAHIFGEDHSVTVKLHGMAASLVDIVSKLQVLLFDQKVWQQEHIFVEVVVSKHGRVVRNWHLGENNVQEVAKLLDMIANNDKDKIKNWLQIEFDQYIQSLIPTDLGIPVVWEVIRPSVQKTQIQITKDISDKIVKIGLWVRQVNWDSGRVGLSFYNPVANLWQGVTRLTSYDSVWPLNLEITINQQQQSVQISWKKHQEEELNVAGLRSHVKQLTFVQDDLQVLQKLVQKPPVTAWVEVSNGKQFRKDYTLMNHEDLNSGHQWNVVVFDSGYHVSNGTFGMVLAHLMHHTSKTHLSHGGHPSLPHHVMVLPFLHLEDYIRYMPNPGIHGLLIRIEPSKRVNSINLSVRLGGGESRDGHVFAFEKKLNARVTYAIKGTDQSLKTWDMNFNLVMNPGHTVNTLKADLTRIIPNQKDYKICIDGVKKWVDHGVTGHVNIALGVSQDGKCAKETEIDVTMNGVRSHEQEHGHFVYSPCHYPTPDSTEDIPPLECLVAHSTVRQYVFDVKTTNLQNSVKYWFVHLWDLLKGHFISHYQILDEPSAAISEGSLKIQVEHVTNGLREVDIHVSTPHHVLALTGIHNLLKPDTQVFPEEYLELSRKGLVDYCVVHNDRHHLNHHVVHAKVPEDWTVFVKGTVEQIIHVKRVGQNIALKVVDNGQVLEIVPHGDLPHVVPTTTIGGQAVLPPGERSISKDWLQIFLIDKEDRQPIIIWLPHMGITIQYDVNRVVIITPQIPALISEDWTGKCYENVQNQ